MKDCVWNEIDIDSSLYRVDCLGELTKPNSLRKQYIGQLVPCSIADFFHACPFCAKKILLTVEIPGGE